MNPLRKSIYILDLLMLGITAVSLFHAGIYRNLVVVAMAWYMLLLRANITFLLWRKERKTIWPIIAFMALFAAGFVFMRYDHVWYRMGRFPSIAVGKALTFDLYPVFVGVFIWVWILPLAAWLWQFFTKKSEKGDSKWPQLYTFSKEGYGLRDRYHELLPSKFRRIEPDANGWKQLTCITREGDTLTYDLYMQKYFVQ